MVLRYQELIWIYWESISEYIALFKLKIETVINLKENEINKLLIEYKMSLINSIVTGKVKEF